MTLVPIPFALSVAAAAIAGLGCIQAVVGAVLAHRFGRRARSASWNAETPLPPLTVLKPLHGDEPMLEEALASCCTQG